MVNYKCTLYIGPPSTVRNVDIRNELSSYKRHICRYPRSTTNIILITYNWSLLPVCFTLSLESTFEFAPSTSFQYLCLLPACSCSYHVFSLCQFVTLTIHMSLSLSLPTQNLPLSQIFPTILSSDLRTDYTNFMTRPFLLSISALCF